jgi:2-polyprenyl-3-methyl-5-hydroxy-6-metoxy-1,4-benzoquinol methylase
MSENTLYEQQLAAEAEAWGAESERMAGIVPPDWHYHRNLRHNVIVHGEGIEQLLALVKPGMSALELGCASGWLTLALAQAGADATGMDLSEKSLAVARTYYESIRSSVKGSVTYAPVDMNHLQLPAETYDIIVVKGVLHHLINLDHVIAEIRKALKPGGLLWVDDTNGDEGGLSVLLAGGFAFLLPTETTYADKWRALFKFGLRTPSRVKASIEADGLSPFEGAGREHDWLKLVYQQFRVERRLNLPAFTGYVSAQWKAPDRVAVPVLKAMRAVDRFLIRLGLVKNTGVVLFARK